MSIQKCRELSISFCKQHFELQLFKNLYTEDVIYVALILFGKTIVYFNQYLQAIYALGGCGIGKEMATFTVSDVKNTFGEPILDGKNVYMGNYNSSDTVSRRADPYR